MSENMTQNIYENDTVKHSLECHSVSCLLSDKEHISVFYFETKDKCYCASSLNVAANMWIKDGCKELLNVGSIG